MAQIQAPKEAKAGDIDMTTLLSVVAWLTNFVDFIHDYSTEELQNNGLGFELLKKVDFEKEINIGELHTLIGKLKGIVLRYQDFLNLLNTSSSAYLQERAKRFPSIDKEFLGIKDKGTLK